MKQATKECKLNVKLCLGYGFRVVFTGGGPLSLFTF
tara:strand:- start:218 stop:325 length:108 start_codon:yes stop_codon:yes gene_type:complete